MTRSWELLACHLPGGSGPTLRVTRPVSSSVNWSLWDPRYLSSFPRFSFSHQPASVCLVSETLNRPWEGQWAGSGDLFPLCGVTLTQRPLGRQIYRWSCGWSLASSPGADFDLLCDLRQIAHPLWLHMKDLYGPFLL